MAIIDRLQEEMKEAMRSRDQVRLETLRMMKAKILAVDARANLSDEEVIKLFKTYFGSLQEAFELSQAAGRSEVVDKLKKEMAIVQEFLPKVPSEEETKQLVIQAINESGAKTKKDLGLVMKGVMKLNSSVDGKMANLLASQLLEG